MSKWDELTFQKLWLVEGDGRELIAYTRESAVEWALLWGKNTRVYIRTRGSQWMEGGKVNEKPGGGLSLDICLMTSFL